MSDAKAAEFQSRVDELKRRFGARLRVNADYLSALIAELDADTNRDECREKIRHLAHSLAGVAGTFGFSVISDAGANLENAVLDDASDDQLRARMQATIDTINREMPAS